MLQNKSQSIKQMTCHATENFDSMISKKSFCFGLAGKRYLVPLIIPPGTVAALNMLASKESRKICEIVGDNDYLFANTRASKGHTSAWHSLHRIMDKLQLKHPEKIKSTTNQHRHSTIMASMDLAEQDRESVYAHMRHSKTITQTIYQAPPAVMELTRVGRRIVEIDEGNYFETMVLVSMSFQSFDKNVLVKLYKK